MKRYTVLNIGIRKMKNTNLKKSGVLPSGSKPKSTVSRHFESPILNALFTPKVDNNSNGANPIIHQCPMIREKPLSVKESDVQLKKIGVIRK